MARCKKTTNCKKWFKLLKNPNTLGKNALPLYKKYKYKRKLIAEAIKKARRITSKKGTIEANEWWELKGQFEYDNVDREH